MLKYSGWERSVASNSGLLFRIVRFSGSCGISGPMQQTQAAVMGDRRVDLDLNVSVTPGREFRDETSEPARHGGIHISWHAWLSN